MLVFQSFVPQCGVLNTAHYNSPHSHTIYFGSNNIADLVPTLFWFLVKESIQ